MAWSAGCLRQGHLVEAAIQYLPAHAVPQLQSVDLCNLLWAVAHMHVTVAPDLLLRFSVSPAECKHMLSMHPLTAAMQGVGNQL